MSDSTPSAPVNRRSAASVKRLTLVATILGSSIALLDGSVVSVALPAIQRSLGGGLAGQQWVSNAYLLTLGSFILIGGSLGDIFGERRIFAPAWSAPNNVPAASSRAHRSTRPGSTRPRPREGFAVSQRGRTIANTIAHTLEARQANRSEPLFG